MITDKAINVAASVLVSANKVLLAKRRGGYLDNLWEFPGGKIEKDETAKEATVRELKEELGIEVSALKTVLVLEHAYPDKKVRLHFVLCKIEANSEEIMKKLEANPETEWFAFDKLPMKELCPADRAAATDIPWKLLGQN